MARELIKLPNNKYGLLILIGIEVAVGVWALAATLYAYSVHRTRTVIYGFIVLFAIFYILGRSLRSYRNIRRREREQKKQDGTKR